MLLKDEQGKIITACGLIEPRELGRVMMHEHLHADLWDWDKEEPIKEERPATPGRRQYLMETAAPLLWRCREEFGMGAFVDATMAPWRAWPDIYRDISKATGMHIIICTGFYREIELGTFFIQGLEDAIWPYAREASVEDLTDMCVREIVEGIHDTGIRAGAIKLGTTQAPMTGTEAKTFIAGARAQRKTGVHITTHCTRLGAESSQLTIFDREGVDLTRVVIGHTETHLMNTDYRSTIIDWMRRGAHFLLTILNVTHKETWQPLIDAIHEVFDAGLGDKLFLGLDSGYCSDSGSFGPVTFFSHDQWCYMYTNVLPVFRNLGLTEEEEMAMLVENPMRILPVESNSG